MPSGMIHVDHKLPTPVEILLKKLSGCGYEAYVVGGAVRDILIGKSPEDYDVATSAMPDEGVPVFGEKHCQPTGIAHGTVTVVVEGVPVEVTTFRVDGDYMDSRHPEHVSFTRSLEEDIKRRDFTINALALSSDGTVIDYCGGVEDLKAGILRTVGDPEERFSEDALRILRGLRFSSEHGFKIEKETARAMVKKKDSLSDLSVERIWKEFSRLICGTYCASVMRRFFDVFTVFLPEIAPMKGFEQHNPPYWKQLLSLIPILLSF